MYNTMRITGLASGIDTEEMIESLMRAERVKVDKVEQDRTDCFMASRDVQ